MEGTAMKMWSEEDVNVVKSLINRYYNLEMPRSSHLNGETLFDSLENASHMKQWFGDSWEFVADMLRTLEEKTGEQAKKCLENNLREQEVVRFFQTVALTTPSDLKPHMFPACVIETVMLSRSEGEEYQHDNIWRRTDYTKLGQELREQLLVSSRVPRAPERLTRDLFEIVLRSQLVVLGDVKVSTGRADAFLVGGKTE
eukprot:Gregarina_sp_Pseudo_9__2533@NODE_2805_length_866_cov_4_016929_g2567_i0_p1_GENE_NODE_2805_length_866_cov_4_016929_g2567_i0NODE_2805_length_866_cov_4_016929_g2567_i0_p1_ORF_typecomplete_len199_score4_48CHMI/PF02962_15/0_079DUF3289/PF11692_8/0_081Barstar/PF01337_18/0_23_NODE_2805_length_866_cov_4_016929_g2567_i0149745